VLALEESTVLEHVGDVRSWPFHFYASAKIRSATTSLWFTLSLLGLVIIHGWDTMASLYNLARRWCRRIGGSSRQRPSPEPKPSFRSIYKNSPDSSSNESSEGKEKVADTAGSEEGEENTCLQICEDCAGLDDKETHAVFEKQETTSMKSMPYGLKCEACSKIIEGSRRESWWKDHKDTESEFSEKSSNRDIDIV
jgi:hypothetical protein